MCLLKYIFSNRKTSDDTMTKRINDFQILSKKEICEKIFCKFNIVIESDSLEEENIYSNYNFILNAIKNDLQEISSRITQLKGLENTVPKSQEYEHKKIKYFLQINTQAEKEIDDYISDALYKTLLECKSYKFIENAEDKIFMNYFTFRYDYAFFKNFYDYNYDFSTEAKIRFIPGVNIMNMQETIEEFIALKKNNPQEFYLRINEMVSENNCIEYISDIIRNHYFFNKREEIFDTLVQLYNSKKYLTFISLAVIQLEGIFYDCVTIMNSQELGNKAGTLVEKVNKTFANNIRIKQALYPYFAFEVPILRNEIAHVGITSNKNLQNLCSETILDIYCILHWACELSNNKYIPIKIAYEKIDNTNISNQISKEELVLGELFSSFQMFDREFIKVLACPELYSDELNFYKKIAPENSSITIKEMTTEISNIVKSEAFWSLIKSWILSNNRIYVKDEKFNVIDFTVKFKNHFISVLPSESPEKTACVEVSKVLKQYYDI